MKIAWHNCYSISDADIVLFGAASQNGSLYSGTKQGPNEIRAASLKWLSGETIQGKKFSLQPLTLVKKRIFDAYNIEKKAISGLVQRTAAGKRVPAMLGGDHSNTLEALKGISKVYKSFSIVYLDAHLDLVSGQGRFYGSVLYDASKLKQLKLRKSACIGCRAVRESEVEEARKKKLLVIDAVKVEELGIRKVFNKVKKRVGKRVYLSIDIDCVDPASAPGVSDPVPAGLTPNQLTGLARMIARNGIIGFDIMEVNPVRDKSSLTTSLAAKLFSEIAASMK